MTKNCYKKLPICFQTAVRSSDYPGRKAMDCDTGYTEKRHSGLIKIGHQIYYRLKEIINSPEETLVIQCKWSEKLPDII